MFSGLLSKRTMLGAILFLVLVGEPTVGFTNRLFTPAGFVVLGGLYFCLFLLIDALVRRYQLSRLGLVLVMFAIYSVGVTGLLHGELASYATQPDQRLIVTLIRVQCSLYPLFAYQLLGMIIKKRSTSGPSLPVAIGLCIAYTLLLTPTREFGITRALHTVDEAP